MLRIDIHRWFAMVAINGHQNTKMAGFLESREVKYVLVIMQERDFDCMNSSRSL